MYTYHICVYTAPTYTNDSKEKEAMNLRWNEGGLGKIGGRRQEGLVGGKETGRYDVICFH